MTSQGTQAGVLNRSLDHALANGDLRMALATARDLPTVELDRAARLLALLAKDRSPLYDKAAVKWARRYVAETTAIRLSDLVAVVDALAELPNEPALAETLLTAAGRKTRP